MKESEIIAVNGTESVFKPRSDSNTLGTPPTTLLPPVDKFCHIQA